MRRVAWCPQRTRPSLIDGVGRKDNKREGWRNCRHGARRGLGLHRIQMGGGCRKITMIVIQMEASEKLLACSSFGDRFGTSGKKVSGCIEGARVGASWWCRSSSTDIAILHDRGREVLVTTARRPRLVVVVPVNSIRRSFHALQASCFS